MGPGPPSLTDPQAATRFRPSSIDRQADDGGIEIEISHWIDRVGGASRPDDRALPPIDGADEWRPDALDRVGSSIAHRPLVVAALAGGGATLGALLTRGRRALLRVPLAAAAGAAAGLLGAWTASRLLDHPTHPTDAAPADAVVRTSEHLRVMTWNIRGGMGPTGFGTSDSDLDRIAAAIRAHDPDIVLLQEVDHAAIRSGGDDNLRSLASRLGADDAVAVAPNRTVFGRAQNVAVLTFHGAHVEDARGLVLADPFGSGVVRRMRGSLDDARAAVDGPALPGALHTFSPHATLDTLVRTAGGTDVRVVTGHYEAGDVDGASFQQAQLDPVADAVGAWDGPTIWGGDFNAGSGRNGYWEHERDTLGAIGLTDAFTQLEVAGDDARRRSATDGNSIDRVYASAHFAAAEAQVDRDADASDHHPVIVDYELRAD